MDQLQRVLLISSLALISTACSVHADRSHSSATAPILLFGGTGTSPNDVAAVKAILKDNRLEYSAVDSSELNAMSEAQFRGHRLLIVPGGNFEQIGNSLTSGTSRNIRGAVQSGLNYLGICAGAFIAGDSPYNGFNLAAGVRFHFYAAENRGIRRAAVAITSAGAPTLDQYWEDGPELSGWGTPVAKYPDGTPAVVEGAVGSGWVVLVGVHPEAPADWRRGMTFHTPVSADHDYAATLIRAALNRTSLTHD